MNFPADIWRLIKSYQLPYKKYWLGKFNECIHQLSYNNFNPPHATTCYKIAGSRHRRRRCKDIGLELYDNPWWRSDITRIHCIRKYYKNGFFYQECAIYYPCYSQNFI